MDVRTHRRTPFFAIALTVFQLGCAKVTPTSRSTEQIYPKPPAGCEGQAKPNRFIVRWRSGHVTLKHLNASEGAIEDFVTERADALDLVEPDYRVVLPYENLHSSALNTQAADNWGALNIRAEAAWNAGALGQGVTVAVVDSGMDLTHPQLVNQIAYNKGESGVDASGRDRATNGVDDDANGFVDDYSGYDFTTNSAQPQDHGSHGTHVSGIIAAEHSDTAAGDADHVQGVAPQAKLLPLAFIDSTGSGSIYDAIRAIDYAVKRGARVINASWGGSGCSTVLRDQIAGLEAKGVAFVAAAGNSSRNIDFQPEYPAAFNLLAQFTVGSITEYNVMSDFSNYGDRGVHIFAPGSSITSTVPGGMGAMSGTSMATPFVAGAIAALLSAKPTATLSELRAALYGSVQQDRYYRNASRGRLDLARALSRLTGP